MNFKLLHESITSSIKPKSTKRKGAFGVDTLIDLGVTIGVAVLVISFIVLFLGKFQDAVNDGTESGNNTTAFISQGVVALQEFNNWWEIIIIAAIILIVLSLVLSLRKMRTSA